MDAIKNMHYGLRGQMVQEFFDELGRFLSGTDLPNVSDRWPLQCNFIEYREGWQQSQSWLRSYIEQDADAWANFVFVRSSMRHGDFDTAKTFLARALIKFPQEPKFRVLSLTEGYYRGSLHEYERYLPSISSYDPAMTPILMKIPGCRGVL